MSRPLALALLGALTLPGALVLGSCMPQGGGSTAAGGSWQALRGAPAERALAGLGTPDSVESQGDSRVYLYRRYRVVSREPVAPVMTPQGQIITPRPASPVELCETRVRVDASGRVADIAQTGGSCATLMPAPS
jgi:hypothetical protein